MSKKKNDFQPNWRPDFCDVDLLPDIKAIRTDFIVNFIALTVMFLLGALVAQREYRSYSLGRSIARLEGQIELAGPKNESFLRLNKRFREASQRVVELEQFYSAPIVAFDYLVELAAIRPADLAFESLSYREQISSAKKSEPPSYTFRISGDVRSLTVLDAFKNGLRESSFAMAGYEKEVNESTQAPNAETGIFPYAVDMLLAPPAKPKPEKTTEDA